MVDKAMTETINTDRQAGADELSRLFPGFWVPAGLVLADIEAAEDMVLDWRHGGESRALELVARLYEYLKGADRSRRDDRG
jgi:hypothetical protein